MASLALLELMKRAAVPWPVRLSPLRWSYPKSFVTAA